MNAITSSQTRFQSTAQAPSLSFPAQVLMLTRRSLTVLLREPASILPGLILGVFFLLVYDASLSGAAAFFLRGQSYLGFILPLSVLSTALSGAGIAGQAVIRDIDSGYFDKLLLTPVSRSALLLAPMIASAIVLVVQTGAVTGVALLLGLEPATGLLGLLLLLVFALLLGISLAGILVSVALRTNSAAATNGASFLFFPFTFLTAAFTPFELLDGWIRTAATLNPITYLLEATRALLNTGWEADLVIRGLVVTGVLLVLSFVLAYSSLVQRTRRK